jgi:hypothetical protein
MNRYKLFALYLLCDELKKEAGSDRFTGNYRTLSLPEKGDTESPDNFDRRRVEFRKGAPQRGSDYSRRLALAFLAVERWLAEEKITNSKHGIADEVRLLLVSARRGYAENERRLRGTRAAVKPVGGKIGTTKRGKRTQRVKRRAGTAETVRTQVSRYTKLHPDLPLELLNEFSRFEWIYLRTPSWCAREEERYKKLLGIAMEEHGAGSNAVVLWRLPGLVPKSQTNCPYWKYRTI